MNNLKGKFAKQILYECILVRYFIFNKLVFIAKTIFKFIYMVLSL